ncbi:MAG: aspartate aminotransferase family protein [Psychromonas sp.]|nr:aspartate aminotransferase family protein [Psychromonas sp.]
MLLNTLQQHTEQPWLKHFIQIGDGNNQAFENASTLTLKNLKSLFNECQQPYSALDPQLLKNTIYSSDLESVESLESVINHTHLLIAKNAIIVQHPHCIAHLNTPPLISSIIAEFYIAALNQSMDSWDQATSATYLEQFIVDWLTKTYSMGDHSDGVFTSGGTQSNFMGLILARNCFARKYSKHNIVQDGLPEYCNKMRIICSDKSHFSVQKSAALMGIGVRSVVRVSTNIQGQMNTDELQRCIDTLKEQGLLPIAIVASAGTTDHGAIDDLQTIAKIAQQANIWYHVDSAYGGAVILSQQHKHRLSGIEKADSVAIDFHKLFFQTISCAAILLKDKNNFKNFCLHADYLNRKGDKYPNLVDKSITTTRRFDALKMYMTLKSVGAPTLGKMLDKLIRMTKHLANRLKEDKNFELCCDPLLTTLLFRLSSDYQHELSDEKFNKLHQTLRLQLLTSGDAVIAETKINGKIFLKFTLLNPCLIETDFDSLFSKIKSTAKKLIALNS